MHVECPHRPPCPGCPQLGQPLAAVPGFTRLSALAADAQLPLGRLEGKQLGYRQRARLAIRGRASTPKIGIFQAGSHRIADIPRCLVHHPVINRAAAAVRDAIREHGVAPYVEGSQRGTLRYLQAVVACESEDLQLTLVANTASVEPLRAFFESLQARLDGLHSLFWNGHTGRDNAILGPRFERIHGPEALIERVGSVQAYYPPGAFGQNHPELYERIVAEISARVPADARVLELFAGVGAIGLSLLARGCSVTFNERSASSLTGLHLGLAARPEAEQARADVLPGAAEAQTAALATADVVVVDPPRKGLGTALLQALCERGPARLVYLACGLPAFLGEAEALRAAGYRLRALFACDLFPFTGHLETLAFFER